MDKLEKILDVIDHQDKYSDEEIRELLQDEECRKFYQTMQEVDSALVGQDAPPVDIDREWNLFSEKHPMENRQVFSWCKIAAAIASFVLVSGIAFAAIHTFIKRSQEPMLITHDNRETMAKDSLKQNAEKDSLQIPVKTEKPAVHKAFENVPLDRMLAEMASYYDMQLRFDNAGAKSLRLYYEWDSRSGMESIVRELNQFENVNIEMEGQTIVVK